MLCISISDSPVLASTLAGIIKHGIWSKHFAFWIKVLFNFIDVNLSVNLTWWLTTLVVCGCPGARCGGWQDPSPAKVRGCLPNSAQPLKSTLMLVSCIPITKWYMLPETCLNVRYEWKAFLKRICCETENRRPPQRCAQVESSVPFTA